MALTEERVPNSIEMFVRGIERCVGWTLQLRGDHPQVVSDPERYPATADVISLEERDRSWPVLLSSRVQRVDGYLVILEDDFDERFKAIFGDAGCKFSIDFVKE